MSGLSSVGGSSPIGGRSFQPPSFEKLDSNSDNGITLDELKSNTPGGIQTAKSNARAEDLFGKMDGDGDGVVTSSEKDGFDAKMKDRMSSLQFAAQLGGQPDLSSVASDIISALDTDGDEDISIEELSDSSSVEGLDEDEIAELFEALDTDGSGSVSSDETEGFLQANKPDGPPPGKGPPPPRGGPEESSEEDDTASLSLDILGAAISAYQNTGSFGSDSSSTLFEELTSI